MRYERLKDIIDLVLMLQTSCKGLSIKDISKKFKVSRRTAERMRDVVVKLFPQIETYEGLDRLKRWRFKATGSGLVSFTSEELQNLELLKKLLLHEGIKDKAQIISHIITKIKSANDKNKQNVETDIEILMEAEGLTVRNPNGKQADKQLLEQLRNAIISLQKVQVTYTSSQEDVIIHPYGLFLDADYYLIAHSEKSDGIKSFILDKIVGIKTLTETFEKPAKFNLKKYCEKSTNIYEEKPTNVKLLFAPEVASEAIKYSFHPQQKIEHLQDGTISIKFPVGNLPDLCKNIFQWGGYVKIGAPQKLKPIYKKMLEESKKSLC